MKGVIASVSIDVVVFIATFDKLILGRALNEIIVTGAGDPFRWRGDGQLLAHGPGEAISTGHGCLSKGIKEGQTTGTTMGQDPLNHGNEGWIWIVLKLVAQMGDRLR